MMSLSKGVIVIKTLIIYFMISNTAHYILKYKEASLSKSVGYWIALAAAEVFFYFWLSYALQIILNSNRFNRENIRKALIYILAAMCIATGVSALEDGVVSISSFYDEDCHNNCTDVNDPPANSPGYHGVDSNGDGMDDYIRSNPDNTTTNNINQ